MRPNGFHRDDPETTDRALVAADMLEHLPDVVRGSALQAVYDRRTLGWLLEELGQKVRHGELRARIVVDATQHVLGWYLHYAAAGAVSELVHIGARKGAFDAVLRRLLRDAWRQGAVAVRGRLDPAYLEALSERHCWLRREDPWTLVHARDPGTGGFLRAGNRFFRTAGR